MENEKEIRDIVSKALHKLQGELSSHAGKPYNEMGTRVQTIAKYFDRENNPHSIETVERRLSQAFKLTHKEIDASPNHDRYDIIDGKIRACLNTINKCAAVEIAAKPAKVEEGDLDLTLSKEEPRKVEPKKAVDSTQTISNLESFQKSMDTTQQFKKQLQETKAEHGPPKEPELEESTEIKPRG